MSQKYTDARYPEKINDLIDNEGGLSEEGKKVITESGVEAKDPRIPEITPEDVGKIISVDAEGNLILVEATTPKKIYRHELYVYTSNDTNQRGGAVNIYTSFDERIDTPAKLFEAWNMYKNSSSSIVAGGTIGYNNKTYLFDEISLTWYPTEETAWQPKQEAKLVLIDPSDLTKTSVLIGKIYDQRISPIN